MTKKDSKATLNRLKGKEKPKQREITSTSQEGIKGKETRATFIVDEDRVEELKAIAYWDGLRIKEVASKALEFYLEAYKKENGEIKPRPKT